MKYSIVVVCSLAASASAFSPAFKGAAPSSSSRTRMARHMIKGDGNNNKEDATSPRGVGDVFGPFAAAALAFGLASQVSFAAPLPPADDGVVTSMILESQPTTLVSALGGGVETMDFSLPSYDSSSEPKKGPPSFNPFENFTPEFVKEEDITAKEEEKAAAEAKKAEEKAAAEAKKAEEKAAAEAKRAEEKAAAEAKKEEERAAAEAKKAEEKEARRQAELEKQKAAAERAAARQAEKEETASKPEPVVVEPPAPAAGGGISIPEFKAPEISIPSFKAPEIPKITMPKFDTPGGDSGDSSSSSPSSSGGYNLDVPSFQAPKIDTSSLNLPKVDLPPIKNPFESKVDLGTLESQEVRDEKAKQARLDFLQADQEAKDLEQKARELREFAGTKKLDARAAKDLACATRPGGKWICARNPFKLGY